MRTKRSTLAAALLVLLTTWLPTELSAQPQIKLTESYTAQRRPRVAVLSFKDTNHQAGEARFGASVEAMLVTFFKRKSQFVVVERQDTQAIWDEWKLRQTGAVRVQPEDSRLLEALEKIDVILLGSVTLLPVMTTATTASRNASKKPAAKPRPGDGTQDASAEAEPGAKTTTTTTSSVSGQRIEIDAKLLSRVDGRIIAAAQRSGPVTCLRSIVDRLGVALEREFLRPYYGQVTFRHTEPENVQVLLTPILLDKALDEEKPPIEYGATVGIGRERDTVEAWITDPTSYTIRNLLTGWYSMRLARPGYEGSGSENARWEARSAASGSQVFDKLSGKPLAALPLELQRYVVRVDPLRTATIDGDNLGFEFPKLGSPLQTIAKRQYLDKGYLHTPQRIYLLGKGELEINSFEPPAEYAEDESCDLFEEKEPSVVALGRTHVPQGQSFDFESFKGGELVIEDYKGEVLPLGKYQIAFWEPEYQLLHARIPVHLGSKATRSVLSRETRPVTLTFTGARPGHRMFLEGKSTGQRFELPLDFDETTRSLTLPVDSYTVSTDVAGLTGWRKTFELLPTNLAPPTYMPTEEELHRTGGDKSTDGAVTSADEYESADEEPELKKVLKPSNRGNGKASQPATTRVKTRMVVAGRLEALSLAPDATREDVFVDRTLAGLLNQLLPQPQESESLMTGLGSFAKGVAKNATDSLTKAGLKPAEKELSKNPWGSLVVDAAHKTREEKPAPPPAEPQPEPKGKPVPPPQPADPEVLRAELVDRLQDVDLLVLNDDDMSRLRAHPEVAGLVQNYVDAGGALLAFVGDPGDYRGITGAPLVVDPKSKSTRSLRLSEGDALTASLTLSKKEWTVPSSRRLPRMKRFQNDGSWRVVAFTKRNKGVRIVERGQRDHGGYVLVWFDRPQAFQAGQGGGRNPDVDLVRSQIERRALDWARHLMERRYSQTEGCAQTRPAP